VVSHRRRVGAARGEAPQQKRLHPTW
jgi:hypothetical protein